MDIDRQGVCKLVLLREDSQKTQNLLFDLPLHVTIRSLDDPVFEFTKSSWFAVALDDVSGKRTPLRKGERVMMKIFDENDPNSSAGSLWLNKPGQCVLPWKQSGICYFRGIQWRRPGKFRVTFSLVTSSRSSGTVGTSLASSGSTGTAGTSKDVSFVVPVMNVSGIQWIVQVKDPSMNTATKEDSSASDIDDPYELQPLTKPERTWLDRNRANISADPPASVLMKLAHEMHTELKTAALKDLSILEPLFWSSTGRHTMKQRERDRKKLLSKQSALIMMRYGMESGVLPDDLNWRKVSRKVTDRGDEDGPFSPLHMADRANWQSAFERTKRWTSRLDEEISIFVDLNRQVRAAAAAGIPTDIRNKIWARRLRGEGTNEIITRSADCLRVHRHEGTLAAGETAVLAHKTDLVLELASNWRKTARAWLHSTNKYVEQRMVELRAENERRLSKARSDQIRFGRKIMDDSELSEQLRLPDLSSDSVRLALSAEGLSKADASEVPGLQSLKAFLDAGKPESLPLLEGQWDVPLEPSRKKAKVSVIEQEVVSPPPPFSLARRKNLWRFKKLPQHILKGIRR